MRSLSNKKCLVTGAALGIGREIALRLAEQGAHLYLLDVQEGPLTKTVADARAHGVEVIGRVCDVGDPDANEAAMDDLLGRWQSLDVLVNNAGICYYGPTLRMTREQMDQVLAVNLLAPLQFTRRLLPTLLQQPEAHVLNVASMYGFVVTNRCLAYHTTKFGLVGFSEALRLEYGRLGLGVTALCPGYVATGLFTSMVEPDQKEGRRKPPRFVTTTAEKVSRKALKAIYRDRRLVFVTPLAHFAYYVHRFAPGIVDWFHRIGRSKKMREKERAQREHAGELDEPQARSKTA